MITGHIDYIHCRAIKTGRRYHYCEGRKFLAEVTILENQSEGDYVGFKARIEKVVAATVEAMAAQDVIGFEFEFGGDRDENGVGNWELFPLNMTPDLLTQSEAIDVDQHRGTESERGVRSDKEGHPEEALPDGD